MVARLLAYGLSQTEVAERTGYSLNRIGILARDPSVNELVARYRDTEVRDALASEIADDYREMNMLRRQALRLAKERLDRADDMDEPPPMRELQPLISDLSDRTGYPKLSVSAKADGDFSDRLSRAIEASGRVINAQSAYRATATLTIEGPSSIPRVAPSLSPGIAAEQEPTPPTSSPARQQFLRRA